MQSIDESELNLDLPPDGEVTGQHPAESFPLSTLDEFVRGDQANSEPAVDATDIETFIPVHGFVKLSEAEIAIVDHPSFQRLGSIYQLGQTHLVYRGATHKRFEHVLGTLHVAQEIADAIRENHRARGRAHTVPRGPVKPAPLSKPLTGVEITFIRLAALLHDIGHLPEGHTLEDELGFLDKHDKTARLEKVLDRTSWPGGETLPLRSVIDERYDDWIDNDIEISPSQLMVKLIAKDSSDERKEAAERVVRVEVCRDIVGNTICADLLDYLHRDWYHIGKPKYYDPRLFQYMEIRDDRSGASNFVISLGLRPKIRTDAVTTILSLLESRYELAESVLFHRTKCSAAAMLERVLYELESSVPEEDRDGWKSHLEDDFLDQSDDGVIEYLAEEARKRDCGAALLPLRALRQRRLYKGISTKTREQIAYEQEGSLTDLYTDTPEAARRRNKAMQVLEQDFHLPEGSLAIYCPDKGMNAKIAKVKIHVNGLIDTFENIEKNKPNWLSGGHLVAQLDRFYKLWRIHVVVAQEPWREMSEAVLRCLQWAIDVCVFGLLRDTDDSLDTATKEIAEKLSSIEGSPYCGREVIDLEVGARGGGAITNYPTGAPTIRLFFAPPT